MPKTETTPRERLLSPQDLAELLQIPTATLYKWRHTGDGPLGIRVGRHVRYRPADVDRWLKSREAR